MLLHTPAGDKHHSKSHLQKTSHSIWQQPWQCHRLTCPILRDEQHHLLLTEKGRRTHPGFTHPWSPQLHKRALSAGEEQHAFWRRYQLQCMYTNSQARRTLLTGITHPEATGLGLVFFFERSPKLYRRSFPSVLDSNFGALPRRVQTHFSPKASYRYTSHLCTHARCGMHTQGRRRQDRWLNLCLFTKVRTPC